VGNLIHRGRHLDGNFTTRNHTLRMLHRMPVEIREHPLIYLFEGGEHWLFKVPEYDMAMPPHAVFFTPEPDFAASGCFNEPRVPRESEACYLYGYDERVIGVPFWQPGSFDTAIRAEFTSPKPLFVFYYGGLHGRAELLRRRLYDLCDEQDETWHCRSPESTAHSAQADGGLEEYFGHISDAEFCLSPTGDSPGRTLMWDALARGCIPVLFSSCPTSHLLQAHAHLLPPDTALGFGVRQWALLINQTAVMTDDQHLAEALRAVTPAQKRAMRESMATAVRAAAFSLNESKRGDVVDGIVTHMLRRVHGGPPQPAALPPGFVRQGRVEDEIPMNSPLCRSGPQEMKLSNFNAF